MANLARGELTLWFDGVGTKDFKWSFYEIGILEEKMGMGLMMMLNEKFLGPRVLFHMLWAGHLSEDPRLTPKKVAQWIGRGVRLGDAQGEWLDLGTLITTVMVAVAKALPRKGDAGDEDEEEGDADPKKEPSSAPTAES